MRVINIFCGQLCSLVNKLGQHKFRTAARQSLATINCKSFPPPHFRLRPHSINARPIVQIWFWKPCEACNLHQFERFFWNRAPQIEKWRVREKIEIISSVLNYKLWWMMDAWDGRAYIEARASSVVYIRGNAAEPDQSKFSKLMGNECSKLALKGRLK